MKPRPAWHIVFILAAIVAVSFAAGFLTGSKAKQVEINRRFDPQHWNVYAMRTLNEKLDLSVEQQKRIQSIIDQTVEDMKTVHLDTIRKTTEVVNQLLSAIDQELTLEQREIAETLSPSAEEVTIDLLKVGSEKKP